MAQPKCTQILSLFKLIRHKNNSVAIGLSGGRWIRILHRKISTVVHVTEFVDLWSQVQQVELLPNNLETIGWRWTRDGSYTSKSAYLSQFKGSFLPFDPNLVWKAKTKNKYKFFAWTLVQNKILTADNLANRGWPHQPTCSVCHTDPEKALHLCLNCPFSKFVWV